MMLLSHLPRLSSPSSVSISKKLTRRTFPFFFSTLSSNPTSTLSPTPLASASNRSSPVTSLSQLSQIEITRKSVFFDDDQVEFDPDSEVPGETQIEIPFEKLFIPPGVEVSGDKSALSRRVLKGSNIVLSDYAADAQISQAEFVKSSKRTAGCPSDGLPEFALVGRSNVGKSSLLNSLVRRKRLALTSKKPAKHMTFIQQSIEISGIDLIREYEAITPSAVEGMKEDGKTQCINHFRVNDSWYLVDLPGYGYATAPHEVRIDWDQFTKDYFLNRQTLVSVFLLIDASIPAKKIDLEYASWLGQNQIPMTLVFTKCDKRKKKRKGGKRPDENVEDFQNLVREFFQAAPPWVMTSSVTNMGREEILLHMAQLRNYWLKH